MEKERGEEDLEVMEDEGLERVEEGLEKVMEEEVWEWSQTEEADDYKKQTNIVLSSMHC